jgi:cytidine deaminase
MIKAGNMMYDKKKLVEQACEARLSAYSPYSQFCVGAALLCADGDVIIGANIENSSYGATNCAERTAFFTALMQGKRDFTAIAIV